MISYKHIKGSATEIRNYYDHLNDKKVNEYYTKDGRPKIYESAPLEVQAVLNDHDIKDDEEKFAFLSNRVRAGTDMTISFTKDVSLVALEDDTVLKDIRETVKEKIDEINEKYIKTRKHIKGEKHFVKGKALIQVFEHHTSRESDPQLHYHCFIHNKVVREDGKLSAVVVDDIVKHSYQINAEISYETARKLREKGYNAYLDAVGDLRFFEDRELIEKFSKRKQKIEQLALEKYGKPLKELSRKEIKELVLKTRKSKQVQDIQTLRDLWRAELSELGYTPERLKEKARINQVQPFNAQGYEKAFKSAVRELDEYSGIFEERQLWKKYLIALSQHARENGSTLPTIEQARERFEQLKELHLKRVRDDLYATPEYLHAHERGVRTALAKSGIVDDTFKPYEIELEIRRYEKEKGFNLSEDQKNALKSLGVSLTVWNGHAGAGKTTAMEVVKRLADKKGIKTIGLAPTGKAAEELSKTFGKGQTVDSFLIEMEKLSPQERKKALENTLIVVDEAGMIDSRKFDRLMQVVNNPTTKVILSGDYKQLQPVQAGTPFSDLYSRLQEKNKYAFAELKTIRRQKKESYLKITKALSEKDFKTAFQELARNYDNYFKPYKTDEIVKDYLQNPESTLVVVSTNRVKDKLNEQIRKELKANGKLKDGVKVEVEKRFQIKAVEDLQVGDKVSYKPENEKYTRLWQVVEVDRKKGKVHLARNTRQGLVLTEAGLNDLYGRTAHRREIKEFSVGDRIITLKNDRDLGVKNGELYYVAKVDKNSLTLTGVNSNKKVKIPLDRYKHIDYSYAITTYKAQGMTFDRVLVADDGKTNYNQFYVATTRGRTELKIYTNNAVKTLYRAQFPEKAKKEINALDHSTIAETMIRENPKLYRNFGIYVNDFNTRRELKALYHKQLTGATAMENLKDKQQELERKKREQLQERKKQEEKQKESQARERKEQERAKEQRKTLKLRFNSKAMQSLRERQEKIAREKEREKQEQLKREKEQQEKQNRRSRYKGRHL